MNVKSGDVDIFLPILIYNKTVSIISTPFLPVKAVKPGKETKLSSFSAAKAAPRRANVRLSVRPSVRLSVRPSVTTSI